MERVSKMFKSQRLHLKKFQEIREIIERESLVSVCDRKTFRLQWAPRDDFLLKGGSAKLRGSPVGKYGCWLLVNSRAKAVLCRRRLCYPF
jgi:hypothetical protein